MLQGVTFTGVIRTGRTGASHKDVMKYSTVWASVIETDECITNIGFRFQLKVPIYCQELDEVRLIQYKIYKKLREAYI
jgi:hypothetical protein